MLFADVEHRYNQRMNQREERAAVEHDLEKEKHSLRLMKGESLALG